jgi:hypothetical protein
MDKQQEFALRTVEERDVRFIRLWFTDVLGTLKSVAIAPAELEAAFEEGLGFDGSAIEGMTRVSEDDMIVQPDPSTFQILPWRGGPQGTARMFCDILTPDGEPSLGDPRHVLKRTLAKAKDKGFTFYVHPEIEFYLFESQDDWSKAPTPIDEGGYFDHVPRSPGMDFRRATVNMLEQMGISVEYSHHEAGPGQNEIDLRYADALTMADNIMTFRTVVKEISLERGIHASFMPKPLADAPGSGMHTHLSLFEGDSNAFYEAGQEFNMSLPASSPPASCTMRPKSARSPTSTSTRTSACGAVTRHQATSAGATTTVPRCCVSRSTSRARATPRAWSSVRSTRWPTHTLPTRCCWPPVSTVSISRCSWASLPVMTCGSSPTANVRLWAFSRCRARWTRR